MAIANLFALAERVRSLSRRLGGKLFEHAMLVEARALPDSLYY
jgi:hypothetical protein